MVGQQTEETSQWWSNKQRKEANGSPTNRGNKPMVVQQTE